MIDKNLRIEISQEDGSILKSNNTGGLKVKVDKGKKIVIISAENIDKSIYNFKSAAFTDQDNRFLWIALLPVLCYLLVLLFVSNAYQMEKFFCSSIFIIIAGFIYSHFYKNYKLTFSTVITFILLSAFVCGFIPLESFFNRLNL